MKRYTRKFAKAVAMILMVIMLFGVAMPIALAQETDNYSDYEVSLQWFGPYHRGNMFTDVPNAPHWQSDPVSWADRNGITTGVGGNRFNPNGNVRRDEFATFLHRVAGTPSAGSAGFADQSSIAAWAAPAVNWASSISVVEGFTGNVFRPLDNISRQQIATMLFRYAQSLGLDTTAPAGALTPFPDHARVPGWATEGMRWAVHHGLITGIDGQLRPTSSATRAQTVTILQRFVVGFAIPPQTPAALVGNWAVQGSENQGLALIIRADGTAVVGTTAGATDARWFVTAGNNLNFCVAPLVCRAACVCNPFYSSTFRFEGNVLIWTATDGDIRLVRV